MNPEHLTVEADLDRSAQEPVPAPMPSAMQTPRPTLTPTADALLVAGVLRENRQATAEFVDRHTQAIYNYVRARLMPRTDLVDDLVQDVFLAAWQSLGLYRGDSSLHVWLLGIARHKVEDYYRACLRQLNPVDEVYEEAVLVAAPEPTLEERLDMEKAGKKILRILSDLPESYRLVLLWRYWEKASAREMAARSGRTEKAIERLLARAREQFKRRWLDDEPRTGRRFLREAREPGGSGGDGLPRRAPAFEGESLLEAVAASGGFRSSGQP